MTGTLHDHSHRHAHPHVHEEPAAVELPRLGGPVPRVGVGGPVGSGKTALIEALVPLMIADGHSPVVVTNDIFTSEDAEHVRENASHNRVSGSAGESSS
jgi:urease accessory protein